MNGIDILVTVGGITIIAIAFWVRHWEAQVDESRRRHEDNLRHWKVIDRIEQYGYRTDMLVAPDFVPSEWEQAA